MALPRFWEASIVLLTLTFQISGCQKLFTFMAKRRDCFKCEIFVARVYCCYKALGSRRRLDENLMVKIRYCLGVMESQLPEPAPVEKKRKYTKVKIEESIPVTPTPPAKKKHAKEGPEKKI